MIDAHVWMRRQEVQLLAELDPAIRLAISVIKRCVAGDCVELQQKTLRDWQPTSHRCQSTGKGTWSRSDRAPETIQLGRQLQSLRAQHKWSLADVARMSGISMSTLSRIENNKLSPTMDVISRLLNGLDIPYHELIIPTRPRRRPGFSVVTRAGHGERVSFPGLGYEILNTSADSEDAPLHAVILSVQARSLPEMGELSGHEGEEFLHVLSGAIELHRQGLEPPVLSAGDSIHFDSGLPHVYINRGRMASRVLVITTSHMRHGDESEKGGRIAPPRAKNSSAVRRPKAKTRVRQVTRAARRS